ncbi:hypothetical protein D3C84_436830 [compost metagenome]
MKGGGRRDRAVLEAAQAVEHLGDGQHGDGDADFLQAAIAGDGGAGGADHQDQPVEQRQGGGDTDPGTAQADRPYGFGAVLAQHHETGHRQQVGEDVADVAGDYHRQGITHEQHQGDVDQQLHGDGAGRHAGAVEGAELAHGQAIQGALVEGAAGVGGTHHREHQDAGDQHQGDQRRASTQQRLGADLQESVRVLGQGLFAQQASQAQRSQGEHQQQDDRRDAQGLAGVPHRVAELGNEGGGGLHGIGRPGHDEQPGEHGAQAFGIAADAPGEACGGPAAGQEAAAEDQHRDHQQHAGGGDDDHGEAQVDHAQGPGKQGHAQGDELRQVQLHHAQVQAVAGVGKELLGEDLRHRQAPDRRGGGPGEPVGVGGQRAEAGDALAPGLVGIERDAAGLLAEHGAHFRIDPVVQHRDGGDHGPERDGGPGTDGADGIAEADEQGRGQAQGDGHPIPPANGFCEYCRRLGVRVGLVHCIALILCCVCWKVAR